MQGELKYVEIDSCESDSSYSSDGRRDKPLGMSNSFSAPDIQSKVHLLDTRYSMDVGGPSPARIRFSDEETAVTPQTPRRDRPLVRSGSPTKMTFDEIREEMLEEKDHSPSKRSRSPVKQLFGEGGFLGRSTSYKEAPAEQYRKAGLKHGIEKIGQRIWNKV